jgi:hypothetical protein
MPDYQNVVITRRANRQITVPDYTVSLLVTDSQTGAVLHDFTGANTIDLWNYLGTLSVQQQGLVIQAMVNTCLQIAQQP